jgi:hypothetical protein
MNQRLEAARAEVRRLEAEEQADEHTRLVGRLAEVSEEIRTAEARREELHAMIHEVQDTDVSYVARVNAAGERVSECLRLRPPVALYLPDDVDVQRWQKRHDELVAERDKLQAEHAALPSADAYIFEATQLRDRLLRLRIEENNILTRLEGRSSKAFALEGGVFAVEGTSVREVL